jgi:transcriptional regulator with XRE-family HTH domain
MAKSQHAQSYLPVPPMLRRMREDAKLTQRDVAKRLRRSQPWVHKSEIGERRVDISEFLEWCLACEANAEEMFNRLLSARGGQSRRTKASGGDKL